MQRLFYRVIAKISRFIGSFFTRISYVTNNKMSVGSWVFTFLSLLGLLLSLGGYYWLDTVSKQYQTSMPEMPQTQALTLPAIKTIRHDVNVVLAIDFSASMLGDTGSDPSSLRLRAAEIMASSLAADIYPRCTQMGYVEFGTKAIAGQNMSLINTDQARLDLVKSINDPSKRVEIPNFGQYTDIAGALDLADQMLQASGNADANCVKPNSNSDTSVKVNTPAIVLLTDGRPTIGDMSESRFTDLVKKLVQKNTLVFMVILRNHDQEVTGDQADQQKYENWRTLWSGLAKQYPLNVEYDDVLNDTQLETIYNKIRSRLVQEGTKLTDRVLYDPAKTDAQIMMPADLLQAHLIVSKPVGTQSITLVDPDGKDFSTQVSANSQENDALKGTFFYMFKIGHPKAGPWKLKTDSTKPLYYLLNTESKYSIRLAWPVGSAYIYKNQPSRIPFVIADENGSIVDKPFNLNAAILKSERDSNGAFVEVTQPLPQVQSDKVFGMTQYFIQLTPQDFGDTPTVAVQLDGSGADGALLNDALIKLPVVDAPGGSTGQADSVISQPCEVVKKNFWPPSLVCDNHVDIPINIAQSDLLKSETISGKVYSPLSPNPVPMTLVHGDTLQINLGPFTSPGDFQVIADMTGSLKQQPTNDFLWNQRIERTVKIMIPAWVEVLKQGFLYSAVLFLVCTLWKLFLVPVFLLLFSLLRFAPDGSFSTDLRGWGSVYRKAMEQRKLFTLTVGYSKPNNIPNITNDNPPFFRNSFMKFLHRYFYSRPRAHIFWIPIVGLFGEDDQGLISQADDTNTMVSAGRTRVYIKK